MKRIHVLGVLMIALSTLTLAQDSLKQTSAQTLAPTSVSGPAARLILTTDGITTITYSAADKLGNTENSRSCDKDRSNFSESPFRRLAPMVRSKDRIMVKGVFPPIYQLV